MRTPAFPLLVLGVLGLSVAGCLGVPAGPEPEPEPVGPASIPEPEADAAPPATPAPGSPAAERADFNDTREGWVRTNVGIPALDVGSQDVVEIPLPVEPGARAGAVGVRVTSTYVATFPATTAYLRVDVLGPAGNLAASAEAVPGTGAVDLALADLTVPGPWLVRLVMQGGSDNGGTGDKWVAALAVDY